MGGRPISSLAMVCFPDKKDLGILGQILAGGLSKMIEAGCTVIGGHSIRDEEIKFGYAVTGSVHPDRILANGGAKAGDVLVLTKALGTGVISTAIKQGKAEPAWLEAAAKIPLLAGAVESVRAGCVPAGLKANREFAECVVEFGPKVDEITKTLLFDPQTAGGLLLSISAKASTQFLRAVQNRGGAAIYVGEVLPRTDPLIMIV